MSSDTIIEYYSLERKKNKLYLVYHVIDQDVPVEHLSWFPVGITLRNYVNDLGGEREDIGSGKQGRFGMIFSPVQGLTFRSIKNILLTFTQDEPEYQEDIAMPGPRNPEEQVWRFGRWTSKECVL